MSERSHFFDYCNLYKLAQVKTCAHEGKGFIYCSRIVTSDSIAGACNFMDFTTMPPGTTIGLHGHSHGQEEYYLILAGEGVMIVQDRNFTVKAGDLIRNPPGSSHSLANNGQSDLQLFVFELRVNP